MRKKTTFKSTMPEIKMSRPKQTYTPKLRYDTFEEAMTVFVARHCVPASLGEIGVQEDPYIQSEIRVVLNTNGGGYIHLFGQDSETIDFKSFDFK